MILSGKTIADEIQNELRSAISTINSRPPGLAVILVGEHAASHIYVGVKKKACAQVGISSTVHHFPASAEEKEILAVIHRLNQDETVDGILVQMPLPPAMNPLRVMESVSYEKDVDGFHPMNMGKLLLGIPDAMVPCTPLGIKTLLQRSKIQVEGKHAVIVGRSNIVGKPLAVLLMQKFPFCNATVTVAHTGTKDLKAITNYADILVAAAGAPKFIKEDMVKEGAVVVDVGSHRVGDPQDPKGYRIEGDVDFETVAPKCSAITPVPKGVGPMTVAMLLQNTFASYRKRCG